MKDHFREYKEILDLALDYYETGRRREHPPFEKGKALSGDSAFAAGAADSGAAAAIDPADDLAAIEKEILVCEGCRLCRSRKNAVPGEGAGSPLVMIIGEAPGAQEDETGRPFVGRAGQYLDKWMAAIGLSRERDLFIGNIIKCRPPNNRDPQADEQAACLPYLQRQLDLIKPKAILTVGRIASHILTGKTEGIGRLHGRRFSYRNIPLVPTYHPSGVLRNPEYRRPVWDDLQRLRRIVDGEE